MEKDLDGIHQHGVEVVVGVVKNLGRESSGSVDEGSWCESKRNVRMCFDES